MFTKPSSLRSASLELPSGMALVCSDESRAKFLINFTSVDSTSLLMFELLLFDVVARGVTY
jgi:hypothetical protein